MLFHRIQTQWQIAFGGLGNRFVIGLNYQAVIEFLRLQGVEDMKATFEDIQVMEHAALRILNQGGD